MSAPRSSQYRGWWDDFENSTIDLYYGTGGASDPVEVMRVDGSGITLPSGIALNLPAGTIDAADITDNTLTGDQVATVANANTEGAIPLIYRLDIAALSTTTSNTDVVVVDKIRIVDAWAIHTGGGGVVSDTLQVTTSTGGAITDAMSWTGADNAVVRAGEIADAFHEIAAAGTVRVTLTNASTADAAGAGTIYIQAVKVA
jgi:hypothetical protein